VLVVAVLSRCGGDNMRAAVARRAKERRAAAPKRATLPRKPSPATGGSCAALITGKPTTKAHQARTTRPGR
jgi:hypothetical protein